MSALTRLLRRQPDDELARKNDRFLDEKRTTHSEWGRWGYIGFVIKKAI
jgi:hypothetical protein